MIVSASRVSTGACVARRDQMQRNQRRHRGADRGEPVIEPHEAVHERERERLHGDQRAAPADRRPRPAADDAADQRADQAIVAPLPRQAVGRAQDDGDRQQHPIAVPLAAERRPRRRRPSSSRATAGPRSEAPASRATDAACSSRGSNERRGRKAPRSTSPIAASAASASESVCSSPGCRRARRRSGASSRDDRGVLVLARVASRLSTPRRLALQRLEGERMVGRQARRPVREQIEAEALHVERAGAQQQHDARQQLRAPRASCAAAADRRCAATSASNTSSMHADRRGEPQPLRALARAGSAAARAPPAIAPTAPPAGGCPRHRPRRGRHRRRRSARDRDEIGGEFAKRTRSPSSAGRPARPARVSASDIRK